MLTCDAIVVGGGPAGSTCAGRLVDAGWEVVVLDRATFPRDKVCAGWVTPEVFRRLDLSPATYAAAGHVLEEIRGFRTGVLGGGAIDTAYGDVVSYAIRRCEFDAYLLARSGARVLAGTAATSFRRDAGQWIVNEAVAAPYLVGAGGHFCPVARHLRGIDGDAPPVVAKEIECLAEDAGGTRGDSPFPELYFCDDLDGYGWCVPKGAYLNVGLGRRSAVDFNRHVDAFVRHLAVTRGLTKLGSLKWHGHAYLAGGTGWRPLVGDGVLTVGDAAGLAYPESGEGIRPAVESGARAAEALVSHRRTGDAALSAYAEAMCRRHPHVAPPSGRAAALVTAVGRRLMRSRLFTRHVVLDRWFLRRDPALGASLT